jgi:hydroxymethylbilane synthase
MLVIASRGSQLALWQARWVAAQLSAAGQECRIEIIKTTGDKITDVPLAKVGTKGLFTKEIEEALLDGRAQLAVHSLNLDTRLRKLDEGQYDAILLAAAGLKRLGWGDRIAEILSPEQMCPAVGQGALAIEARAGFDGAKMLDHADTRTAVFAERAVLGALGGGCQVPIGAYATVSEDRVHILAIVAAPDGTQVIRAEAEGPCAEASLIGASLAAELLTRGARQILEAVYS